MKVVLTEVGQFTVAMESFGANPASLSISAEKRFSGAMPSSSWWATVTVGYLRRPKGETDR